MPCESWKTYLQIENHLICKQPFLQKFEPKFQIQILQNMANMEFGHLSRISMTPWTDTHIQFFDSQILKASQFLSAQLRHLDGFDASISQIFFSVESHLGLMTNYCHKLPKKSSRVQKTIPTLKEVFSSSEDNSSIGFSNGIKKSFHFESYEKSCQPHCLQRNAST